MPRDPRDSSLFLVRGDECFAFHEGNNVGAMRASNCEAAQALRSSGLTAAPLLVHETGISQVTPAKEWRQYNADDAKLRRSLKLAGEGELAGVALAGPLLFGQWRNAAGAWLTAYLEHGTPVTGQLPIAATDQILFADEAKGLVFVRWDGDRPTHWLEVPARIEWRRADKTNGNETSAGKTNPDKTKPDKTKQ